MGGPGIVTLGGLRVQAQERADMVNSSFLSTSEWNRNIMGSYKELYDLLIAAYGNDYYVNQPVNFQTDGSSQLYALPDGSTSFKDASGASITPPGFYKLLGVDLALQAGNPGSYVTIRPFNFADRNRYAVPNFQSFYGVTNLRYRLQGDKIWFTPIPAARQTIQLWYVPRPSDILAEVICGFTSSSATVTCTDTSQLATGMTVEMPSGLSTTSVIPDGTTISTITPNTSFVMSQQATATRVNALVRAWKDSTTIDGVSGWEEYIIVDSALKAMGKEEDENNFMVISKQAMVQRLKDMAINRDAANPATVADVQWSDFWWPTGNGSGSGWGAF